VCLGAGQAGGGRLFVALWGWSGGGEVGPAVRVPPGATGGGEGVGPEERPEGDVPREAEARLGGGEW